MRIQVLSDLHTESHEFPLDFLSNGKVKYANADVMVLAGDIVSVPRQRKDEVREVFEYLSRKARYLVYVTGNHEYWGWEQTKKGRLEKVEDVIFSVFKDIPNAYWLNNSEVTIEGQHFLGGTMWFKRNVYSQFAEKMWKDFELIYKLGEWAYDSNRNFQELVLSKARKDSVVVTHHVPLFRSVHEKFWREPSNMFFVCDMAQVFFENYPKLWVHGHTHESWDYEYQQSRVVCNPYGYDKVEDGLIKNKNFQTVVIEV